MSRASTYLKLGLASIVVVPVSAYGGLAIKEYFLSRDLDRMTSSGISVDRATGARIVQLAQERQKLIQARNQVDAKILSLEKKLEMERANAST